MVTYTFWDRVRLTTSAAFFKLTQAVDVVRRRGVGVGAARGAGIAAAVAEEAVAAAAVAGAGVAAPFEHWPLL